MPDDVPALNVAAAIVDVTRELARSTPPPRGAPYFCLDVDSPYDLQILDPLCHRGIFRKYELALDIGSGLGGRARWLAARAWCRVVGIDPSPAVAAAAAVLNRRARMDDQVSFHAGRLDRLPLRDRVFTHVWMVDAALDAEAPALLNEAFRVLRRGAQFALQCAVLSPDVCAELLATLRRIGFVDLESRAAACAELPHACRIARERLRERLGGHRRGSAAAAEDNGRRWRDPSHEEARLQIFARRPA